MPFVYVRAEDQADEWSGDPPLDHYTYEPPFMSGTPEPVHFSLDPLAPGTGPEQPDATQQSSWEQERQRHLWQQERQRQRLFAIVIPELEKAGVRRVYCRYDGGGDEGFAWPDYFEMQDGGRIGPHDMAARLHDARFADRLHAAGVPNHYRYVLEAREPLYERLRSQGRPVEDETDVYVLRQLCEEWAALLLGVGFGTGEYSMYGSFMVDLAARTITDDRVSDPEGHRASKLVW